MKRDWKSDLSDSAANFMMEVAPIVEEWLGGEIVPVESVATEEWQERIDQFAGVDYWVLKKSENAMRGVASRTQWGSEALDQNGWPYRTHTIRKDRDGKQSNETEFKKRLRAIRNDYEYPYWSVHAYLTHNAKHGGELMSVSVCRTKDLILHIECGTEGMDYEVNYVPTNGAAYFYAVPWDIMEGSNRFKNHRVKDIYENWVNEPDTTNAQANLAKWGE